MDIRFNDIYKDGNGNKWRVVSFTQRLDTGKFLGVGLSGPGPCRGMYYVSLDELNNSSKWSFYERGRSFKKEETPVFREE